jgi:OOP family OmpA-OmpF porin
MSIQHNKLLQSFSAAVLILGLAAIPSMAQAENWYAGASAGQSKVQDMIECDLDISCSSDDTDTGWKIFGGYQFNPNGAVEFGYVDLGKFVASGTDSFLGDVSFDAKPSGFTAALVGSLPIGQNFGLMGKVGMFFWDVDVNASSSVLGSGSDSSSGTDLTFGLGLKYDFSKIVGVRAEWERFMDVGDDNTTGQSDIDLLSVGVVFKF